MLQPYWSDIKLVRERTLSEYEGVLDAVESAVAEHCKKNLPADLRSILHWETLGVSLRNSERRFKDINHLSETRLRDIHNDTRTAEFLPEEDAEFSRRCETAQFRTAHLARKIRQCMELVDREIRSCGIREASSSFKPALPTQVDFHV